MNKKHKPFEFDKEIRKHMDWGRIVDSKQQAVLSKMLEEPDRKAKEDPVLGINCLLETVIDFRDLLMHYLQNVFGYEVPSVGIRTTTGRFLRPELRPRNPQEIANFVIIWSEWLAREIALHSMARVLMDAAEATCLDEVYRAVRETCKQAMGTLNDLMISKLLSDSYADGRLKDWISGEEAIAWFSARVATKTSLQVNRRLKQSLKEESNSPFSKLIWELPGTVRIELEDLVREGEPPSALARRVAKHLEELGGQSAKLQRKGKLVEGESSDITTNESMLEEFLAKEELEELRISSGLSERECQVLELMLAQYNGKEIAEKLEISQGSVKTYKRRLCEKLRQAAG